MQLDFLSYGLQHCLQTFLPFIVRRCHPYFAVKFLSSQRWLVSALSSQSFVDVLSDLWKTKRGCACCWELAWFQHSLKAPACSQGQRRNVSVTYICLITQSLECVCILKTWCDFRAHFHELRGGDGNGEGWSWKQRLIFLQQRGSSLLLTGVRIEYGWHQTALKLWSLPP